MRNRRYPRYPDDADYTTNSPSYYDDLAKKSKLIKLLSERIWEYDEELAKRFEAWDKNLEELPDDLKKMLVDWIDDGTLDQIINETLFEQKPDRSEMMALFERSSYIQTTEEEPTDERVDYWFQKKNSITTGSGETIYKNVHVGTDEPDTETIWLNT